MMNKREWMLRYALTESRSVENVSYIQLFVEKASKLYDAIVAATPDQADEGWIEHRGEKPYPEGMVDIELRDGSQCHGTNSDEWVWTHDPDAQGGDIVKWRPARA